MAAEIKIRKNDTLKPNYELLGRYEDEMGGFWKCLKVGVSVEELEVYVREHTFDCEQFIVKEIGIVEFIDKQ